MSSKVVYEDKWGEVIARPSQNLVEIRWYDTTELMSGVEFNNWLSSYAGCVESCGLTTGLIDAVQFKMPPDGMNMGWRDENIIPRYNAAGMGKLAFIMPVGMPLIGNTPTAEGPANFPTGYFSNRSEAVSWLMTSAT